MSFSIGLSASDREPGYPEADPAVLGAIEHLEFGGSKPIGEDEGIQQFLAQAARPILGRHLVSLNLPTALDVAAHARKIRTELAGLPVAYSVIDVGLWTLGAAVDAPIWFRPCRLTKDAARQAAENASAISQSTGVPLFIENPFVGAAPSDGSLQLVDFMCELADAGASLCLDIGHFHAWYVQHGCETSLRALGRLPFEAVGLMHLAGLASVEFGGCSYELDNHEVLPSQPCLELLRMALGRVPGGYITYEAEFATPHVQLTGLSLIRSARGQG